MINCSEILPLRPVNVNKGKFYLLLRSGYFVNGCVFTRVYVIWKICEKLRRIPTAVDICYVYLNQYYEIWDNKEWVLVRREVLVSRLFFRSCSLETFYLASILKMIAMAAANVQQMYKLLEAFEAWSLFSFASR